jgi:hypothetical protein
VTQSQDELERRVTDRMQRAWNDATDALEVQPVSDADAVLDRLLAKAEPPVPLRRSRTMLIAAVTIAAAAALLFVVWPRGQGVALPEYVEDSFEGGLRTVRKDAPPPPTGEVVPLLPKSRVRWVLVPKTATKAAVDLRLSVTGDRAECLAPSTGVRIAESGAIELAGTAEEIFGLPPGVYVVTAMVGTREAFDADGCEAESAVSVATRRFELRGQ